MKDGYGSKKFWFAIGVVGIGFTYSVMAATRFPEMRSIFDTFAGILEFVTAAYLTGNVANKFVAGKWGGSSEAPPPQQPPKKDPNPPENPG